ncbi:MAG: ATP-binding protein [Bacteroidota bacterium]|nr:ATP-binding protein [Bacteroidota bacterium]
MKYCRLLLNQEKLGLTNKGELLFPKSEFGKKSEARNRLLVDLLARTDFMEKAGTGIKRVTNACIENGNEVSFEFSDSFWVTMYSSQHVTENVTEDVTKNVTESRLTLIMNEMKLNPKISYNQLSKILNVARMTVFRDIERLKEDGRIKRIGPAKGGHWEIIQE